MPVIIGLQYCRRGLNGVESIVFTLDSCWSTIELSRVDRRSRAAKLPRAAALLVDCSVSIAVLRPARTVWSEKAMLNKPPIIFTAVLKMNRAILMLGTVVLFSLISQQTSSAHYRHSNNWHHHHLHRLCPASAWWHVPTLRQAMADARVRAEADGAGILYRKVAYSRWCAYAACYR
jgi:hypothetical protein